MLTSVDRLRTDGPSGDALNINELRSGVKAWIAACVSVAFLHAGLAHAGDARPFCASATDTLEKDAATRDAVSMIFGRNPAYVPEQGPARACIFPVATLMYPDARVLIMGSVPGEVYPVTEARLSAYFLRSENGAFRLVTVRRDFADGGSGMGNVGKITAIRYGADEGMTIAGDGNGQGYDYGSVALFVFRSDGIASLGTIPTSYSDGGAVDDPAKETQIEGKVEIGQPQPDQVRVVYSIRRSGKVAQQAVVWKLRNGRFVAASGSVPAELRR
ncbi:hypothetical protein [Burkholderia paludis]|uniref:hypothetical protein n=1 Tax=Burkholderia paludis TaxID=1506587 RepID=UPI00126A6B8F|nr:hypothetical protein [Burkholderia paludis]